MTDGFLPQRYSDSHRLGEGAFGVVYSARDTILERTVAVKVLKTDATTQASFNAFIDEARALAGVAHQHVVTIFDIGQTASHPFITMEFAGGGSTADVIERGNRYELDRVADLVAQAAAGLTALHSNGLIHRDIKPSNLLLADSGDVLVGDLGLARSPDRSSTNAAGTIVYMAPEQTRGKEVSPATDVFALAASAYEFITGMTHGGIVALAADNLPPPVSMLLDIDPEVDFVLDRALMPNPSDRTPTPALFATELADALATGGSRQRPSTPVSISPSGPPVKVRGAGRAPDAGRTSYTAEQVGGSAGSTTCIGIKWSGVADPKKAGAKIWRAVVRDGELVFLGNGLGQHATGSWLVEVAEASPTMVVGADFGFSLPDWYMQDQGLHSATDLWDLCAGVESAKGVGSQWPRSLPPPFWGPHIRPKPELDPGQRWLRRTEEQVATLTGASPKSVFQLTGAGSVGSQSMRGMPVLKLLRESGFAVWPMDDAAQQMVIEVYVRSLINWLAPGSADGSLAEAHVAIMQSNSAAFSGPQGRWRATLAQTPPAFEAAIIAWALWRGRDAIARLGTAPDPVSRLEGKIWLPPAGTQLSGGSSVAGGASTSGLANPHFGNIGDVVKHLLLAEILADTSPAQYVESHAGAPRYRLTDLHAGPGDVNEFLDYSARSAELTDSAYRTLTARMRNATGEYPGSTLIAAELLGHKTRYDFFDDREGTVASLKEMLRSMRLDGEALVADGIESCVSVAKPGSLTLIDPFSVPAKGVGGINSAEAFSMLARSGDRTALLWYPVTVPKMKQSWPTNLANELRIPIWRCEIRLPASCPGLNGCGMLIAGLDDPLVDRLAELFALFGDAMSDAYPGTSFGSGWNTHLDPGTPWTPRGVYRPT